MRHTCTIPSSSLLLDADVLLCVAVVHNATALLLGLVARNSEVACAHVAGDAGAIWGLVGAASPKTVKRAFSGVNTLVLLQVALQGEGAAAVDADVGLDAVVEVEVTLEVGQLVEGLAALAAGQAALQAGVRLAAVLQHLGTIEEGLKATAFAAEKVPQFVLLEVVLGHLGGVLEVLVALAADDDISPAATVASFAAMLQLQVGGVVAPVGKGGKYGTMMS